MKINLSVIIPSRTQEKQFQFLARSISSIYNQSTAAKFNIEVIVAVDKGGLFEKSNLKNFNFQVIESNGFSQAKALNAGIKTVGSDLVAFLEDDDQWNPRFLEHAVQALLKCDFVSSTQSEYNENNEFIRINDFPTPSGWIMRRETLKKVGDFNDSYRFHLDNEWLGRLGVTGARRVHLIESTAPIDIRIAQNIRPWLSNLLKVTAGRVQLLRHDSPYPLINRLVHSKSGMAQISINPEFKKASMAEIGLLRSEFGCVPW